ncbi:MAG: hypothetical protein ACP5KS_09995 [Candidatus Hydrogenedens sp.]
MQKKLLCFIIVSFLSLVAGISCKSTPKEEQNNFQEEIIQNENVFDLIKESALLNVVIRKLGGDYPLSISVVNGAETRWVQIDKPEKEIGNLIQQISSTTNMSLQEINGYYFLYPTEQSIYENLTRLSLSDKLPSKYEHITVTAGFGAGTKLFNVLNSLNFTYGCNIVADNSIAELPVGEIVISQKSLSVALEMILKSARIVPQNIQWCATDDFIFFYTILNMRKTQLVDCKIFNVGTKETSLDKEVIISLPRYVPLDKKVTLPFYEGALPLSKVAPVLANQTGLTIEMMPGTENLPVNPCYLNKMKLKLALDLLTFQWLDISYSYYIENEKIVFLKSGK